MIRFVARRLASMVAVLFAISLLTFLIFQTIPNGDPALRLAGRLASPQTINDVRTQWGFDKPIYVQYFKTMGKIFDGSVISYAQQQNVEHEIARDLPVTVALALGAAVLWLVISIVFGAFSALRAGRWLDRALTIVAMIGVSMPVFFFAALLDYYAGYKWKLLPISGYVKLLSEPGGWLTHLILPWISIVALAVGLYSRVLRSNMIDALGEDYVRTARAKGLSERRVLFGHVLRNSLVPIVSLWGLDLAALFGGATLLTESVFNLHGVGQYAAEAIGRLDVPPILVITMLTAFFVVIASALTDIAYAALDPRIRLS
jgi:peptide/nickel transport system permease protein